MIDELIGYRFNDSSLIEEALTHSSLFKGVRSYQRLEFVGDAVVGIIASHLLYERYPDLAEGELSRRMSWLVGEPGLAAVAREIGLGEHIRLGAAEEANGGRDRDAMLADVFEALAAALYLDGGLGAAMGFVAPRFIARLDSGAFESTVADAKTELQASCQARNQEAPTYATRRVDGSDHEPVFESTVTWGGRQLGQGSGRNKKSAEQAAALMGLQNIGEDNDHE